MSRCENCKISSERVFATCRRCQTVSYCSKECQTIDWKKGHKKICCLSLQVNEPFDSMLSAMNKSNVTIFDRLKEAINRSDITVDEIRSLIRQNNIDMKIVANKLLLEAASASNEAVIDWLLLEENNLKLIDIVDDKGRNIIMIMLLKKKQNLGNLLCHLVNDTKINIDICSKTDQNGNNILHYAVQTKDCNLLEFILSSGFQDNSLFRVYRYEKTENIPYGASFKGLHEWKNDDGKTPRDLALFM